MKYCNTQQDESAIKYDQTKQEIISQRLLLFARAVPGMHHKFIFIY
jgi:hypothetical protein